MTAMPVPSHEPTALDHPLTIGEYAALGETESGYTELIEGSLLMSPSPMLNHMIASGELFVQIREQLPAHLRVVHDIDIDLQLGPPSHPGFSRRPDLVVVNHETVQRVVSERRMLRASEVLVVIEIVSPGSRRTDYVHKRDDYAEASIPKYWIVDLDEPVSLLAYHLTEQFGYRDDQESSGTFSATEPFPITLDLDQLG